MFMDEQIFEYFQTVDKFVSEAQLRIKSVPIPAHFLHSFQGSSWLRCSNKALGCDSLIMESDWINHHVNDCPWRPLTCDFVGISDSDRNTVCQIIPFNSYLCHLKQVHGVTRFQDTNGMEQNVRYIEVYDKTNHFYTNKPYPFLYLTYNAKHFVVFTIREDGENNYRIFWFIKLLDSEVEAQSYSATVEIQDSGISDVFSAKFSTKILSIRDRAQPWSDPGNYCACLTIPNELIPIVPEKFTIVVKLKYNPEISVIERTIDIPNPNSEDDASQEQIDEESESES